MTAMVCDVAPFLPLATCSSHVVSKSSDALTSFTSKSEQMKRPFSGYRRDCSHAGGQWEGRIMLKQNALYGWSVEGCIMVGKARSHEGVASDTFRQGLGLQPFASNLYAPPNQTLLAVSD